MKGWTKPQNSAWFELHGPDAVRYLSGQVSNNIKGNLSTRVVPACVCTLKGKVEALVKITAGKGAESLLIEVEKAQAEDVFARLDRYLIADDCELREVEEIPLVTHLIGIEQPQEADARKHTRFGPVGFDVFGDFDTSGIDELPADWLDLQKRLHGIPEHGFEITGEDFPASLGLDKWAVDFHKGCYLGQEIVSRMESSGKVPKRLCLFRGEEEFKAGHKFTNEAGKEIASVVRDSLPDGEGSLFTTVFAKDGFELEGAEKVDIDYPEKV